MMRLAVLGSTGSVGTQTLKAVEVDKDIKITALVTNSNERLLREQAKKLSPEYCALISKEGESCLEKAIDLCDTVVVATSGITSLKAVLYAIKKGVKVAIANKETLVSGGILINEALKAYGGLLRPVDSEHSAVWQCIGNRPDSEIAEIILTASGGAFRNLSKDEIVVKKAEDALRHPTWNMGKKITIDSATLMNKALEVIEAYYLFGKIPKVVVHRESIVHSMVEFVDGSIMAQLAMPDMTLPILYALNYPERKKTAVKRIDFSQMLTLSFEKPSAERFPCLNLAYRVLEDNEILAGVLCGANEECVKAYLDGEIGFYDIYTVLSEVLDCAERNKSDFRLEENTLDAVFVRDKISRATAKKVVCSMKCLQCV